MVFTGLTSIGFINSDNIYSNKKNQIFFDFILLVLWLFDFSINIPGLSIYSLLFFVIGASFSIMKYNLVKFVGSCFPYSLIGYCFIVLVELNLYDWAWINNLHKMGIF